MVEKQQERSHTPDHSEEPIWRIVLPQKEPTWRSRELQRRPVWRTREQIGHTRLTETPTKGNGEKILLPQSC